jgi:hypothetical protein
MSVIGAIVSGAERGFKEYGEGVRRQKAIERDDKRFEFEQNRENEAQRVRDASAAFATQIKELNEARANGQLPGSDDNVIEQPPAPAPTAIAAPGAEGAAPAAAEPPRTQNIFKSGGEGLYRDQKLADDAYYKRLYDVTANYLSSTGQADKVLSLQKQITEMQQQGYEPLRKAAAAAVAMGHPNAMQLVAQASKISGTPTNIDPTSGVFDRETQTWKGVKITGADGKTQVQDIPAQNLLASIGSLDAGKVLEFNYGRADAAAKQKVEQQKADADTTRARSSATTAADNARTNATTRAANDDIRRRAANREDDESAAKFFSSTFGLKEVEVKTKDEIEALMPDQRKAYEQTRQEQVKRRDLAGYAQNIYTLNERKVGAPVIAQAIPALQRRIAEGKGADGIDPASGLPFVNINGKKILLPKD